MPNQEELFKVRDIRKKNWSWIDNEYLNGYAKFFGVTGTAIYISLCRHVDNDTQKCFPSQKQIADELNISEKTVRFYIQKFAEYHIVSISKERITGKWARNIYTLLSYECWVKPSVVITYGEPSVVITVDHRKLLPTNYTHTNYTQYIYYNFKLEKWIGITDKDKAKWSLLYPAKNISLELGKMGEWLLSNPNNAKKNYRRFINNWLNNERNERHKNGTDREKSKLSNRQIDPERKQQYERITEVIKV